MKSLLLNVIPAQAGISPGLFVTSFSTPLLVLSPTTTVLKSFPAAAFAPLLLCVKPFSLPFFFLEKKETKIQGCIKKAKIFRLPLREQCSGQQYIKCRPFQTQHHLYLHVFAA